MQITINIPDHVAPGLETLAQQAGYRNLDEFVTQAFSSSLSTTAGAEHIYLASAIEKLEQLENTHSPQKNGATMSSESALEIAQRLGLVGAFRSGVPDLATNPQHMEGFGR
jgi:hypothetical protein